MHISSPVAAAKPAQSLARFGAVELPTLTEIPGTKPVPARAITRVEPAAIFWGSLLGTALETVATGCPMRKVTGTTTLLFGPVILIDPDKVAPVPEASKTDWRKLTVICVPHEYANPVVFAGRIQFGDAGLVDVGATVKLTGSLLDVMLSVAVPTEPPGARVKPEPEVRDAEIWAGLLITVRFTRTAVVPVVVPPVTG
jgi:hypothetical protein